MARYCVSQDDENGRTDAVAPGVKEIAPKKMVRPRQVGILRIEWEPELRATITSCARQVEDPVWALTSAARLDGIKH